MIYKICSQKAWQTAVEAGRFDGAEIDLQDGFIHFSAAHQVRETARKHFAGQDNLVLVEVNEEVLGEQLKWEVSRGGDQFPHLYGHLNVAAATSVSDLPLDNDGTHVFPTDIPESPAE